MFQTYLRSYDIGKERTSYAAPDLLAPRTTAAENLLSTLQASPSQPISNEPSLRRTTFLDCDGTNVNDRIADKTVDHHEDPPSHNDTWAASAPSPEVVMAPKAVPPHLRPKHVKPSKGEKKPASEDLLPQSKDDPGPAPKDSANEGNDAGIPKKVAEDHGAKVGDLKPATPLVSYSSSEEKQEDEPASPDKLRSTALLSKRGNLRARGKGKSKWPPKSTRWPDKKEMDPDPDRWKIRWDEENEEAIYSSGDSVCTDAGFGGEKKKKPVEAGIDPETGFKLTDYDGNWAPAPIEWDARPAYRDDQSTEHIEKWMARIDEEMCGKEWVVSKQSVSAEGGTVFNFAPDPDRNDLTIAGDPAPRYWIPIAIGKQAPKSFWNDLVSSDEPEPFDENDLVGAKPWWETYQVKGGYFLKHYEQPNILGIDPDESRDERLARENDFGSYQHAENRRRTEKAKIEAQREKRKRAQDKARKVKEMLPQGQKLERIKPGLNLYIRSAVRYDIPRVREIFNHYVDNTISTPETKRLTDADMMQRYNDIVGNKLPFLVACERGGRVSAYLTLRCYTANTTCRLRTARRTWPK